MKTKEQIEQLAERYADGYSTDEAHASYIAFQDGYFKCQEDMNKKYTEEDIRKAVRIFFPLSVDDIVKLDKYINSLNTQD